MPHFYFDLVIEKELKNQGGMILEDSACAFDKADQLASELSIVRPELRRRGCVIRVSDGDGQELYRTPIDAVRSRCRESSNGGRHAALEKSESLGFQIQIIPDSLRGIDAYFGNGAAASAHERVRTASIAERLGHRRCHCGHEISGGSFPTRAITRTTFVAGIAFERAALVGIWLRANFS